MFPERLKCKSMLRSSSLLLICPFGAQDAYTNRSPPSGSLPLSLSLSFSLSGAHLCLLVSPSSYVALSPGGLWCAARLLQKVVQGKLYPWGPGAQGCLCPWGRGISPSLLIYVLLSGRENGSSPGPVHCATQGCSVPRAGACQGMSQHGLHLCELAPTRVRPKPRVAWHLLAPQALPNWGHKARKRERLLRVFCFKVPSPNPKYCGSVQLFNQCGSMSATFVSCL